MKGLAYGLVTLDMALLGYVATVLYLSGITFGDLYRGIQVGLK